MKWIRICATLQDAGCPFATSVMFLGLLFLSEIPWLICNIKIVPPIQTSKRFFLHCHSKTQHPTYGSVLNKYHKNRPPNLPQYGRKKDQQPTNAVSKPLLSPKKNLKIESRSRCSMRLGGFVGLLRRCCKTRAAATLSMFFGSTMMGTTIELEGLSGLLSPLTLLVGL